MKSKKPHVTDPLHYPQLASMPIRTRRAWWLLLMTLILPGSAQILAGNRRWGRRILRVTLTIWLLVLATVIAAFFKRDWLLALTLTPWFSLTSICVLLILAFAWLCILINTLTIIRIPLLRKIERPLLTGALLVSIIATSGSLGYAAYLMFITHNTLEHIFSDGIDIDPVDGRYNFLLLGGDAGENRAGRRPDSISVISIDAKSGEAATIAIPRNTQNAPFAGGSPMLEEYPDGYNCGDDCIINHLYPEVNENYQHLYPGVKDPGAQAVKEAVSGILGITVQAYVLIDMEGFVQLIDAVGGIRLEVGGWVPISGAVIEGTDQHLPPEGWIAPEVQKMDGKTALWYGRSREWVTDFSRIQRQQCVQQAMLKQLTPAVVFVRFQELAETSKDIIESDISINQLGQFVGLADKSKSYPMERLTVGPPDFGDVSDNFNTYPDWNLVHARVYDVLHNPTTATDDTLPDDALSPTDSETAENDEEISDEKPGLQLRSKGSKSATEAYLQQLAINGQTDTLVELLSNNGECKPF